MFDKNQILKRVLKKEDKVLVGNVLDKYIKYKKSNVCTYTNFLNIREYRIVSDILNSLKIKFNTYKAHTECEKAVIYFGEYDNFVTVYCFKSVDIKHKDVLGTLFNIGYEINVIGDIFIDEEFVYITNLTRLNDFLENNLCMIKNNYITLEKVNKIVLSDNRFIDLKIVVPSYRLDVIVSKLSHKSRSEVNKYIKDKNVLLNYEEITNPNKVVNLKDIISIRKVGKFIIEEELSKSKKDNYFLRIKKYN